MIPRRSARAAGIVRSPPTRRPRPSVSAPSAPACRPWRSDCVRSGRHGTPCVRRCARIWRRWRSRRPEASGIALTICSTLSRTMASSFVSNMASSNRMISLDMASASFRSRFSCSATENRTRHGPCSLPRSPNHKVRRISGLIV